MRARSTTALTPHQPQGLAGAAQAADPGNAALRQENRAPWHLGRAVALGRDRIPGEVCRGQGTPSLFQGHPGGLVSWRVALMWGTVIVAVVLGVLAAGYLLIQTFVFG